MQYDEFRAMNSAIILAASGDDLVAIEKGFSQARQLIVQSEKRFTRFSDTSELAGLNRSAGVWFQASPELFEVIKAALQLAIETDGLFNPAILPALKQAGYDRSMELINTPPGRIEPTQPVGLLDFRTIQLDEPTKSILLLRGMEIDLGGIAKGWIAEQAARQLAKFTHACAVSAGGDMFLVNIPQGETSWEIGLEDPRDPERDLAILHVQPGAVATSSITKRRWNHNGKTQHHLIDPRSGEPAVTKWLSTTVWAERAVDAEVYAKVLLIAGPQQTDNLFKNQHHNAYLAVDEHGWVQGSENYHEVFNVRS